MKYKFFALFKLIIIVVALGIAGFLALSGQSDEGSPDQKIIFLLDINRTMNTNDVLSGNQSISRIAAAKRIITDIVLAEPGYSYGLVLFNAASDYIVPPTFDTGTFFLYLLGVTTNLLPQGAKNFDILTGVVGADTYASLVLLSDFDASSPSKLDLPFGTSLIGLGSVKGDVVRTTQGIRYYDNGASVVSFRNDTLAKSFAVPYTAISDIADFSPDALLAHGIELPLSQRIVLYTLLGVLVILVVFL